MDQLLKEPRPRHEQGIHVADAESFASRLGVRAVCPRCAPDQPVHRRGAHGDRAAPESGGLRMTPSPTRINEGGLAAQINVNVSDCGTHSGTHYGTQLSSSKITMIMQGKRGLIFQISKNPNEIITLC